MAGRTRRASAERPAGVTDAPPFLHSMCRSVPVSMFDQITPLILTYNELPNIERTLAKLAWAKRIIVIDSGSTDGTLEILRRHPQVSLFVHEFVDFAGQCNFGLAHIESRWVLSLDADYELSDELLDEMRTLVPSEAIAGYRAEFVYRIHGRLLRGTLYPPRTILYRRDRGFYRQEGHGHRVRVEGDVLSLRGVIFHDDRKPLSRWLAAQQRYAADEAAYLLNRAGRAGQKLARADRVRLMGWPAPIAVLLYVLFVKRCVLDGWPGWYYALQRLFAETLLALEIIDRRFRNDRDAADTAASGSGSRRGDSGPRDDDPARMVAGAGDR
jgi:glycosyltransferase involved in cell wall biosynthesis